MPIKTLGSVKRAQKNAAATSSTVKETTVVEIPVEVFKDIVAGDDSLLITETADGRKVLSVTPSARGLSAPDRGTLDQLTANQLPTPAALTDADQTITVAQGRLRTLATVTADRDYTVSTTGAVEGDTITVRRTSASPFAARFLASSNVLYDIAGAGTVVLRFSGAAWGVAVSTRPNGPRELHARDYAVRGGGVIDDTAALQALLNASLGEAGPVLIPRGVYRVTSTITLTGNYAQVGKIRGEAGGSAGFQGTRIVWGGGAGIPVFDLSGVNGLEIEDLEIDCQGSALCGYHVRRTSPVAGASNVAFTRCSVAHPQNATGAACWLVGTNDDLQASEITWRDCVATGDQSIAYLASGVKTLGNGNVKNFRWWGGLFQFLAYHFDWNEASGIFVIDAPVMTYSHKADFRAGGGCLTVTGAQSEGSHRLLEGGSGGGIASATLLGVDWNGTTDADDYAVDWRAGALALLGCTFINSRTASAESKIRIGDATLASATGASAYSVGNYYAHSTDHAPIYDGSGNDLLSPRRSIYYPIAVESRNDYGGAILSPAKLRSCAGRVVADVAMVANVLPAAASIVAAGEARRHVTTFSVPHTVFQTAALTADVKLCELPARTRVVSVVADTTVAYAGVAGAVQLRVGHGVGGNAGYLIAHDVKTAPVVSGNLAADLGVDLASPVQGGHAPAWGSVGQVWARLTSGAGNLTGLTAGSTTFHLVLEMMP